MNVCLLTSAYGPAGGDIGRRVQALAGAVVREGGTAEVLVYGSRVSHPDPSDSIRVSVFPPRFAAISRFSPHVGHLCPRKLVAEVRARSSEFDVLHVHGRQLLGGVEAAGWPSDPQLVFTPHYYTFPPKEIRQLAQGRDHRLDRRVLTEADLVICVSHIEALDISRSAPRATVKVIPNGVDTEAIAAAHPLPVEGRVILTVGELTRWGGVERIISALPAMSPAYHLVVAGSGPGRNRLDALATYLRVTDRVHFVGEIEDSHLYQWLRTASVVVTLKKESLWGGILLDAAFAGVPVVASDIPAYREAAQLLGRDDIRFVSRRASPFVVADAIRDQALAGARANPTPIMSWEQMAERVVSVYHELVSGPMVVSGLPA